MQTTRETGVEMLFDVYLIYSQYEVNMKCENLSIWQHLDTMIKIIKSVSPSIVNREIVIAKGCGYSDSLLSLMLSTTL